MSKSDTFENDLVALIFNATPIANLADNAAASPLTSLYLALHTADPGEAGAQNANECAYTGYARVAVTRNSAGFTVAGSAVTLTADNDFPEATAGNESATFFSVGVAASGATKVLYRGALAAPIAISAGVIPRLKAATSITED